MKILFFTHYYSPEGNAPASRVSALCERWVAAGHEVTVVTGVPSVPNGIVYDGYTNKRKTETIRGVRVERIKTYLSANKGVFRRMLNFLSYFVSALWTALRLPRPDVVIATSPQLFCGYAGVWYRRLTGVPLVVEIRDIWPESMISVGLHIPGVALWVLERIEDSLYRTCKRLVTVGEGYADRLRKKGVPAEKISVIMNGTDLSVFSHREKDAALLAQYGLEGKFVVSYIGTIGMACGLDVVLRAAELLKSETAVAFVLVGDGASRAELEATAKARNLTSVIFTGRQPKSVIPTWIASSDANLVHLRKTELFETVMPSKIFESAGCARPIIMGVDGFAKKLVLDAEAGLDMCPEDADSLVACIRRLSVDPKLCHRLGLNGYERIAKVHNRDRQAADYLQILEGLLREGK